MTLHQYLLAEWRKRRLLLILVFLLISGLAATYALLARPVYKVSVVLIPAEEEDPMGGLASLAGQFGGLASLVGISGSGGQKEAAIALLKSRTLFMEFSRQQNLFPVLFPGQWDQDANGWKSSLRPDAIPTDDDAWELFNRSIRTVSQDQKTGIVTLNIRWRDGQLAAEWANELVRLANSHLRERSLNEADRAISALHDELDETSIVGIRDTIFRLIETQIRRKVVAKSRPEYAFSVLDAATAPDLDRFDSPRRALIVVLGAFLGAFAVLGLLLLPLVKLIPIHVPRSGSTQTKADDSN